MIAYLVNPLSLFLGVWGTATFLYFSGVLTGAFPWPQPATVAALLLNGGTFCLGYLTCSLFRDLPPRLTGRAARAPTGGDQACRPLTEDRLARALRIALFVGVVSLGLELYRLTALAAHFNTSWSYLVAHPFVLRSRLVQFISGGMSQTSLTVVLLSLTGSIFSIGFVLLGLLLYLGRTWWKYFYLFAFLSLALLIGLLHMSRYEVTTNILYLVFAYCFLHAQESAKSQSSSLKSSRFPLPASHFKLLIPIFAIALLFLAVDVLLHKSAAYGHTNPLQGFAFQVYWYLASPLAAFNDFVTTFSGRWELGENTFFPFYKWLCRLDLVQQTEISIYVERVYLPYLANVYTYLRNFYADFGLLGVALAPYVLGWLTAVVQRRAGRHIHYLNLYIILLLLIALSFFNFFLVSNQIYLQILFGFVFFRYEWGAAGPAQSRPMLRSYQDSRT